MKRLILVAIGLFCFHLSYAQEFMNDDEVIGYTYYDLQTWRAMQNRLFAFDDGTFGAVWNLSFDDPGLPNKGIGYRYFDGNQWTGTTPNPWQSITSEWAVFPSYTAFGENGELCFSQGATGLIMSSRNEKGSGAWNEVSYEGTNFKHPVVVGSGVDHSIIQLLCLDPDPDFMGTGAQPQRGAIRYSRSTDGGSSWDISNTILEGMGGDDYLGFTIGSYAWAEPAGDVLAFVAGDFHTDLILMKSTDGGDNWQKTIIWEHPYPFFELGTFASDSFYCNDGGIAVVFDGENTAHVVFSLTQVVSYDSPDSAWFRKDVGGIVYWNEDRDSFSSNINALNPYGHPDSELLEDYSLIGWSPDINGNGELDLLDDFSTYPTPGICTMPQIIADGNTGDIIVAWSGVTETYDNGLVNFRHIWARGGYNAGSYWGDFVHFTDDLVYIFSEHVYPSLANRFDYENIYVIFQEDNEPGLSGTEPPYSENRIWFYSEFVGWIPTTVQADFTCDTTTIHENQAVQFINLSEGYPPNMITYFWEFEGGVPATSMEAEPLVEYPEPGFYDVSLTASIYPIAIHTKNVENYITVLPGVRIGEHSEPGIIIHPNPATGMVGLEVRDSQAWSVRVIGADGVPLQEFQLPAGPCLEQIDVQALPRGLVFLEFNSDIGKFVKKLVLK